MDYKYTRDEVYQKLREEGIGTRKYFYPLTSCFECYKEYAWAGAEKTPIAEYLSERVLAVPLFADMDLNVVDRVCDIILE